MKKQKIGKRIRHIHIPHNPDVMQTVCEICGAEMDLRVATETHTDTDGYDKDGPIPRAKQSRKRILSVTIKRMVDTDPDTSYLGEYSNRATSEFSIDREHSEDCASQEYNHHEAVDMLERILEHITQWHNDNLGTFNGALGDSPAHRTAEALDAAYDSVSHAQDDVKECDCNGGDKQRNEYQYFNPSFNYVDSKGNPKDLTPEEVRKYTRQDYERMERLNAGDWCYIGIRAEVDVQTSFGSPIQTITSGGLWGIESDSDKAYFAEVAAEELGQLKTELRALGFSARAISKAFKSENVKEENE